MDSKNGYFRIIHTNPDPSLPPPLPPSTPLRPLWCTSPVLFLIFSNIFHALLFFLHCFIYSFVFSFYISIRFYVFCSEESCRYRYQFDNLIELMATWNAAEGNGVEGQVSVTQQVSEDQEEGLAKLQISVFLTAASRRELTTDRLRVNI